ncbi:MAG: hypothetical protein D6797_08470 [Bdellovibrio sp.]|nr:MAG: hypothetical protein D6797_08470 [Bdellovibrio sp.]
MVKYFLQNIKVVSDWSKGRYHVFVGITGQGKSSSLVKLASHLVIKEKKKIAIVSCDTYKVGASEQLKIFSQILNVPFACIKSASQWSALEQKLKHYDRVLVDLPGKSLKTPSEVDLLFRFIPPFASKSVHYVQSILSKDQEAFEVARRFQQIGFHDVIFTHLDEAHHFGLLYNFQKEFGVPLHSFGTGSKVPEDYEPATKERVVDLIFKLTERKSHGISATAF